MDQKVTSLFLKIPREGERGGHLSLIFFLFYAGFPLILSTHKKLGFRNVPHHFQIALLLAVESLTTFTSCGQLTQLFST